MAKLQRDDAKKLWEQMGEPRGWKALAGVLEQHLEKSKGIEDSTVRALLCEARDFQKTDVEFPDSANKMLQVLNESIDEYRGSDCAERLKQPAGDEKSARQAEKSGSKGPSNKERSRKPEPKQPGAVERRVIRLTTTGRDDLHTLYKRGNWKNWDEMIAWLRQRTQGGADYPEDLVQEMIEDMQTLKAHGARLNDQGEQTFQLRRGRVVE